MKVGLSVSVIQRGKSGVATYVAGLLQGLAELDWPVRMVLFGLAEDREWFSRWLGPCEWVAVPESERPAVRNVLWHQTVLPGALRQHGCDLVHIPSYRRLVAFPGVPQVATIHDCAPFRLAGKYDRWRMLYGRQVVTRLARRAARVIAVSETTAADIREFFRVEPARLRVVYNGIDHGRFRPVPRKEVAQRLPVTRDWSQPWWIYVARLEHPAKNHLRLLEAFARVCAAEPERAGRLVLAGADWHGAEEIHRAIAASPVRQRIHLAGFVPDDALPAWYSGARALVFPSLFEGFGLPPIEAMACGCPVLSSACGSLGEVVGEAGLIFDPLAPTEIADTMLQLLQSEALAEDLRQRGLARAASFHWRRCAEETVAVYREALLPRPGGPRHPAA